jgi:opacity protein-like surface antigen
MKNIFLSFVFIFIFYSANAQNFHLDLFAGTSNYQGDLQDNGFPFDQAHFAGGVGLSYDLTDHFAIRTGITLGKVSADDKLGKNRSRNLNFTSNITEGKLELQYFFTPLQQTSLTPYIFAGIAVYHFDPYTHDSTGKKYYLKPLSTEGEGFLPGVKNYNLTQMAIPLGLGVKLNLSDNINVGLEMGFRKLFTDYLDDVSTTYVDESLLLSNRGAKAVELAYRGDELKNGIMTYPDAGSKRGSPKAKDMYYFTGLTLSFKLGSRDHLGRNSEWACPKNVL